MQERFGDRRVDPYAYMRDLEDPRVQAAIREENAYFQALIEPLREERARLFQDLLRFSIEAWESYPYEEGPYRYFFRMDRGLEHPQFWRIHPDGTRELLLDPNPLQERHAYVDVTGVTPSPDGRFLLYLLDTRGDETHHLLLQDLDRGETVARVERDIAQAVWLGSGRIFFVEKTATTRRPFRVWRWDLGREPQPLWEEEDEAFFVWIRRSLDGRFLVIQPHSMDTTALWLYHPEMDRPRELLPRERGVESLGEPRENELWILTNRGAPQFRLVRAPLEAPDPRNWEEVIPEDPDVGLMDFRVFTHHVALLERREGRPAVRVLDAGGTPHAVTFPDPVYEVRFGIHTRADTPWLRLEYANPVTPPSTYLYHMERRELVLRHRLAAPVHPERYRLERVWVPSHDGVKVPVSLVIPRTHAGPRPLLLVGYGAYGYPYDLGYRPDPVALLERGVVYAVAHVRGGGELGKRWHDAGKLLQKKNTFLDFIAVAEALRHRPEIDGSRVAIRGGSAGGLMMGAVVNMRPDLFRVVLAEVPFVDVLNTMLDPDLPLTVTEYDEWGNPHEEVFYRYIRSYSPYDNIREGVYPHILATGGVHDPRVRFWEPLKWVARLRDHQRGTGMVALRMDLEGGHFGPSGRTRALQQRADLWALLLALLGESREFHSSPGS